MNEPPARVFWFFLLAILCVQVCVGLFNITDPFIDGRYHYNWNPPFWLTHAETINSVGLAATYGGLSGYPSHPQLIGPVIALWTQFAGYSEAAIRLLALLLSVAGTLFLTLGVREFLGNRRALAFAALFAALPVIYIYGRMMNHEVLLTVFLGLHLWGIGLYGNGKNIGLALIAFGSLGMMLSDWSGAVLALLTALGALIAWGWKEKRSQVVWLTLSSFAAAGLGLLLYLLQSFAQAGMPSIHEFIEKYVGLWQYRAGLTTETFSWLGWLTKQFTYLSINFTLPLALAGLLGLIFGIQKKHEETRLPYTRHAALFGIAVLVGSILYLMAVPQASSIHVYYQYFVSIPIAIGLVLLIDSLCMMMPVFRKQGLWWTAGVMMFFLIAAGGSAYQYHKLLYVDTWGDKTDIELIALIKKIPKDETVITVNTEPQALLWFKNPNIVYYAGRVIPMELLGVDVPKANYVIMPTGVMPVYVAVVDNATGFGTNVIIQAQCSTNLCLTQIQDKNGVPVF